MTILPISMLCVHLLALALPAPQQKPESKYLLPANVVHTMRPILLDPSNVPGGALAGLDVHLVGSTNDGIVLPPVGILSTALAGSGGAIGSLNITYANLALTDLLNDKGVPYSFAQFNKAQFTAYGADGVMLGGVDLTPQELNRSVVSVMSLQLRQPIGIESAHRITIRCEYEYPVEIATTKYAVEIRNAITSVSEFLNSISSRDSSTHILFVPAGVAAEQRQLIAESLTRMLKTRIVEYEPLSGEDVRLLEDCIARAYDQSSNFQVSALNVMNDTTITALSKEGVSITGLVSTINSITDDYLNKDFESSYESTYKKVSGNLSASIAIPTPAGVPVVVGGAVSGEKVDTRTMQTVKDTLRSAHKAVSGDIKTLLGTTISQTQRSNSSLYDSISVYLQRSRLGTDRQSVELLSASSSGAKSHLHLQVTLKSVKQTGGNAFDVFGQREASNRYVEPLWHLVSGGGSNNNAVLKEGSFAHVVLPPSGTVQLNEVFFEYEVQPGVSLKLQADGQLVRHDPSGDTGWGIVMPISVPTAREMYILASTTNQASDGWKYGVRSKSYPEWNVTQSVSLGLAGSNPPSIELTFEARLTLAR